MTVWVFGPVYICLRVLTLVGGVVSRLSSGYALSSEALRWNAGWPMVIARDYGTNKKLGRTIIDPNSNSPGFKMLCPWFLLPESGHGVWCVY